MLPKVIKAIRKDSTYNLITVIISIESSSMHKASSSKNKKVIRHFNLFTFIQERGLFKFQTTILFYISSLIQLLCVYLQAFHYINRFHTDMWKERVQIKPSSYISSHQNYKDRHLSSHYSTHIVTVLKKKCKIIWLFFTCLYEICLCSERPVYVFCTISLSIFIMQFKLLKTFPKKWFFVLVFVNRNIEVIKNRGKYHKTIYL
jgi:hypothetical protein